MLALHLGADNGPAMQGHPHAREGVLMGGIFMGGGSILMQWATAPPSSGSELCFLKFRVRPEPSALRPVT